MRRLFALLAACSCAAAHAAVTVSSSAIAPTVNGGDVAYLPAFGNDASLVAGGDDASTYLAFDRASKGQTFTTGADAGGYILSSISVQHVQFTTGSTWYDVQPNDVFEVGFGTISGTTKTVLFSTTSATYTGSAIFSMPGLGTGRFLTFDLSGEGLAPLAANTTYYFELTTQTGNPFLELHGTSVGGSYAGGQSFNGGTTAALDSAVNFTGGDFAFHVDLAAIPEPSAFAAVFGGVALAAFAARRRRSA